MLMSRLVLEKDLIVEGNVFGSNKKETRSTPAKK